MPTVVEYVDVRGRSLFARWFDDLDARAAAKVAVAIVRMREGNLSNVKSLGGGLFERRLTFGPGYRIYFGFENENLVILLGGGQKRRQSEDIAAARRHWRDYLERRSG